MFLERYCSNFAYFLDVVRLTGAYFRALAYFKISLCKFSIF